MDEIRNAVENYIESKSHSLLSLAKVSGVSYTSLKRFMQREYQELSLENVFKLTPHVMSQMDERAFFQSHYPDIGAKFGQYQGFVVEKDIEDALYNFEKFTIITMAGTHVGTSREEIRRVLSQEAGSYTTDSLIEDGLIIEESDGKIICKHQKFASRDADCILEQARHLTRLIRKSDLGRKKVSLQIASESTTREIQVEIHNEVSDLIKRTREKLEKNPGTTKVFLSTVLGEIH